MESSCFRSYKNGETGNGLCIFRFYSLYAELFYWKKVEPKGLEGCLESVDTLVMDECPELIRITRADYVRNNFKVSVYHFLVHISGEDDDATADA